MHWGAELSLKLKQALKIECPPLTGLFDVCVMGDSLEF